MRLRYLVTEFSQIIHKELDVDPYDIAFDFLQRWLRADPKIFLYENRLESKEPKSYPRHALPDIFYLIGGPPYGAEPNYGNPEYMDLQLSRAQFYLILEANGSTDNALNKIRKILDPQVKDPGIYSDIAVSLNKEDIEPIQWDILHRVSASMALVLRYCHESWGYIPEVIRIDFKAQYEGPKKRGRRKGKMAGAIEDIDHLLWLINSDLHPLQNGGAHVAAIQIKEVWDIERTINSIYQNILPKYGELLKKNKQK